MVRRFSFSCVGQVGIVLFLYMYIYVGIPGRGILVDQVVGEWYLVAINGVCG